jgi:hypothetical protein
MTPGDEPQKRTFVCSSRLDDHRKKHPSEAIRQLAVGWGGGKGTARSIPPTAICKLLACERCGQPSGRSPWSGSVAKPGRDSSRSLGEPKKRESCIRQARTAARASPAAHCGQLSAFSQDWIVGHRVNIARFTWSYAQEYLWRHCGEKRKPLYQEELVDFFLPYEETQPSWCRNPEARGVIQQTPCSHTRVSRPGNRCPSCDTRNTRESVRFRFVPGRSRTSELNRIPCAARSMPDSLPSSSASKTHRTKRCGQATARYLRLSPVPCGTNASC